jgi:hypothetical protein
VNRTVETERGSCPARCTRTKGSRRRTPRASRNGLFSVRTGRFDLWLSVYLLLVNITSIIRLNGFSQKNKAVDELCGWLMGRRPTFSTAAAGSDPELAESGRIIAASRNSIARMAQGWRSGAHERGARIVADARVRRSTARWPHKSPVVLSSPGASRRLAGPVRDEMPTATASQTAPLTFS